MRVRYTSVSLGCSPLETRNDGELTRADGKRTLGAISFGVKKVHGHLDHLAETTEKSNLRL